MNKVPLPPCRPSSSGDQRSSATIDNMPKPTCNHQAAIEAIEKVLALLRSMHTLEGTDKDGVEHLLEMAVENLKK
jgi:hypothetical protein